LLTVIAELAALSCDQTIKDGCSNVEALGRFFAVALVLERRKPGKLANFHAGFCVGSRLR
jgi:hypothetical protein